ncbi:MAG TPA: DUF929 family protein [Mycobacteriales bacterium]|nr:DUF929 family protein [Mycobacteriales bacterium]
MAKATARGPKRGSERTRAKVAAQRAAQQRQERRRRMLTSVAGIVVIVLAIGGLVGYYLAQHKKSAGVSTAAASLVAQVTGIPASVLTSVGDGGGLVTNHPKHIVNGASLTANGKPEVVYIGAEYCPYCAAERWAMVNALSRFGTFTNLHTTRSAVNDGNIATFTFYQSTYSSPYVAFTPTETRTNQLSGGTYATLQTPSKALAQLLTRYDGPPYVPVNEAGGIPFVDIANRYVVDGSSYVPTTLGQLSWTQIAGDLANPSSPVTKGIVGAANELTAAICTATQDLPTDVCAAPGVLAATRHLG